MGPAVLPLDHSNVAKNGPYQASVVPACPARLAFTKEDFLSSDFTVDGFLSRKTATVSLERLRDDLGVYLKVLRSAMIELINQDYADFVNLSTNLVGLDESLKQIEDPLILFSDRAKQVEKSLQEALVALKEKLEQRENLQAKRVSLQSIEHVVNTLNKVERLLGLSSEATRQPDEYLSGDLVERVAADVNYLNFCVSKCDAPAFVDEIRPRLKVIGTRLQGSLETQLFDAVINDNRDALRRCLRVFATVDQIPDAQVLVRKKIVSPYLDDIINVQSLNEDPQGLKGLFQRVNKIINSKLDLLIQLTQNQSGVLRDFNFLVDSLWVDIVEKFDENLSFIYSAGDPEKFHMNYTTAITWLDEFEKKLGDIRSIEYFRSTQSYVSFMGRWNILIYFQIRQQEIGIPVELAMEKFFERSNGSNYHLNCTDVVMTSIQKCWDPSIFISTLTHRFWKMTLQILARFSKAASVSILQKAAVGDSSSSSTESRLKPSATSTTLAQTGALMQPQHSRMTHSRSASDQGSLITSNESSCESLTEDELVMGMVLLYIDIETIAGEEDYILNDVVSPLLQSSTLEFFHLLRQSLKEGIQVLTDQQSDISKKIVEKISARSSPYLKQVSDIPRLYRRTNRELPSKSSTYLVSLLSPLQNFHTNFSSTVKSHVMNKWLTKMFDSIAQQYLNNVSDVLSAVQKMEESLQRLKKNRGVSASTANEGKAGGLSDDDKIRLQLLVDVQHFITIMEGLGVTRDQVSIVNSIDKLVKDATKSFYNDLVKKPEEGQ